MKSISPDIVLKPVKEYILMAVGMLMYSFGWIGCILPAGGVGGNPYGMKYMVGGGGGVGFSGKRWARADSMLLPEVLKLVYITEPSVVLSPRENPLVADYFSYVDFAFGFGDARPIIFSNPA